MLQVAPTDEKLNEELRGGFAASTSESQIVSVEGTKVRLSKAFVAHAEKIRKKSLILKFPKFGAAGLKRKQAKSAAAAGTTPTGRRPYKRRKRRTSSGGGRESDELDVSFEGLEEPEPDEDQQQRRQFSSAFERDETAEEEEEAADAVAFDDQPSTSGGPSAKLDAAQRRRRRELELDYLQRPKLKRPPSASAAAADEEGETGTARRRTDPRVSVWHITRYCVVMILGGRFLQSYRPDSEKILRGVFS